MDEARRRADDPLTERYLLGELSPEQMREVELRSLQDQELFDILLANSLIEEHRNDPAFREVLGKTAKGRQRSRNLSPGWAIALAAGLAVCGIYYFAQRPHDHAERMKKPEPARSVPQPVIYGNSRTNAPVVFAALLSPRGAQQGEVFRGTGGGRRAPRSSGEIVAVEDGEATVALGSLDGIRMGDRLRVMRDGRAVGQLHITAVFRDRARGSLLNGSPGDRVAIEPARQVEVLLVQAEEAIARGDLPSAQSSAQAAKSLATKLRASEWKADELLGRFQGLAGDVPGATQSFESALSALPPDAPSSRRALLLEALVAVLLVSRDAAKAQQSLTELDKLPSPDPGFEGRKLNSYAVLAELQGDVGAAASFYQRARAAASSSTQREAIGKNASRLKDLR